LLIVVVALAGLVTQAYRPAAAVLLSELMPEQYKVMAFSMMRIALNSGAALAPLIAAGLILVDWSLLYWFDGATALLYSALAFVLLPRKIARPDAEPVEPAEDRRSGYAVLVRDKRFLVFLVSVFTGTLALAQFNVALPLDIVANGHPTGLYSAVLATSSIVLITVELKLTTYVTRMRPHVAVFAGHLVLAVGLAGYGLSTQSSALVIISTVVCVSGMMIVGPSMSAHPALAPAAVRARYVGASQALMGLGLALGPTVGVFVWSTLGSGIWPLFALITAVAGLLSLVGMKPKNVPRPATEPKAAAEVVGGKA
jgi:MFS family permease